MVALSHTLHCLSHRRPYYMPYSAWRIPFLSALNFNANTLRLPPYSAGCFDITLHFLHVCVRRVFYRLFENQWGDLSALAQLNMISTCWLLRKTRRNRTVCGTGALPALGASAGAEWEKAELEWARAFGWVGEESRGELGVPLKPHSTDPRSRTGIKVACFMWRVWYFEVPESPTALTSSSSLVS